MVADRGTPKRAPWIGLGWQVDCPLGSSCALQYCAPTAPICSGRAAAICDADGLGPTGSTGCSQDGHACNQGVCIASLCKPGSGRCADRVAQRCSDDSLTWITVDTCKADEC